MDAAQKYSLGEMILQLEFLADRLLEERQAYASDACRLAENLTRDAILKASEGWDYHRLEVFLEDIAESQVE